MSWSTAPTLPERKTGPAWTTTATLPTRQGGAGWFTLIERVGQLAGSGVLSAAVGTTYPHTTTALSSTGTLSAAITTIRTVPAAFTGSGSLTGELRQTRSVTATFTGSGGMAAAVNDGLWGIIDGGTRVTDGLSGVITGGATDGLSGTITPVATHEAAAAFSTEGALAATAFSSTGTPALLTATGVLAGTGTPQYTLTGSFTVTGMLTAPIYPLYARDAALSGVGGLAATVESGLVSESRAADFTGAGVLAATGMQQFTAAAAFTGAGSLAGTITASYARSAALTGTGTLSATATKVPIPTITNITTSPFYVGNTITVTGTGFVAPVSVTVGGVAATSVTVGSSTSLTCVIPSVALGAQNVVVTAASGASSPYSITLTAPVSPLAYVNSASAATTTVAMPAHVAGDLLVAWVWRDGSTTAPTVPAGWVDTLVYGAGTTCWAGLSTKIAQSSSETTGTWTGATHVAVAVYRSGNGIAGLKSVAASQASSATITYPALTRDDTGNNSWILRAAAHRTATNMTTNTPAGYTQRTANADIRLIDSNGAVASNPTADTQAVNATSGWIGGTLEILDALNTANFSDDFNTGTVPDTTKWSSHPAANTTIALTSQRLRLSTAIFGGAAVASRAMLPMTGRTAAVQIPTTPTGGAYFLVGAVDTTQLTGSFGYAYLINGLEIYIPSTTASASKVYKYVNTVQTVVASFTLVVGNYYRIRESAGTYFVDTSTTGTGSWTNITSTTFTVPIVGRIGLLGIFGGAGQVEFDNFTLT